MASNLRPDALVKAALALGDVLLLVLALIAVEMFLMLQQMRQLSGSLPNSAPSANRLDAIRSDLDRMQPDLHQVNLHLQQVQANTSGIDASMRDLSARVAALNAELAQVNANLRDVDQHVANLDRKTGPTPPAPVP